MDSRMSPGLARGAKARARVSLLMLTVALSACGGGGGSSPPPPPPPPPPAPTPVPTLALKADAASVLAGGQPVGLHATLGAAPTSVTWTLAGPGTLSATTGSDVQYTPPDAEGLDNAQPATITITTFNFPSQSVDIAVGAVDRPGHHWTLARAQGRLYSDVAVGKDGFVAAGFPPGLSRSPDGLAWTDVPLYPVPAGVTWGDAGWVAVTNQGVAWFSADSITWTQAPDAIPDGINHVIYGNHTYLAYDTNSNSAVSTDGLHWTPVPRGTAAVAFGNGEFMALRQVSVGSISYVVQPATSVDGINWQPATSVPNLYTIAFANGQFDASAGSWVYVTGDGATWIGSDAAPGFQGFPLHAAGNTLFELGPQDMGVQLPGAGWQRVTTGDFLSNPVAVAANADRFVGVSSNGWIETSPDALHWSTQVEGSYGDLRVLDVVDGQFVALSDRNHVLRSADGVNWTKAMILPGSGTTPMYPSAIAHAAGTVVAVGSMGYFGANTLWIRSLDGGATWAAAATTGPAESMVGVVHDGKRFVSISASGKVYASPDGDAWGQIGTAPAPLSTYRGVAYGGGTYLAFADGAVATSPDGVSWTTVDANAFGVPLSHLRAYAALWSGTQFVLMGSDGQSYGYPNLFAAASADGRAWTRKDAMVSNLPSSLAMCGGEIVGIGNNFVASSTDGLNWYSHATVSGATQLNAVACTDQRFVGVGWASAIVTSTR